MRILLLHQASTSNLLVMVTLKLPEALLMKMQSTVEKMGTSTSLASGHKVGGIKVTMELGELGEERLK